MEYFALLKLAWENRRYRKKLRGEERATLGKFGWYRALNRTLQQVYRWQSPFAVSRLARRKVDLPAKDLIYGETPLLTAWQILSRLEVDHADHVVECGGGRGLMSLVAVSAFGCRATMLEIVPSFVKKTRRVARLLGLKRLESRVADILVTELPDASVYYVAVSTLSDDSWKQLQRQLAAAPVGSRAVSLSEALDSKVWRLDDQATLKFSWGENRVFIHTRI